jgi:hypothetical protein
MYTYMYIDLDYQKWDVISTVEIQNSTCKLNQNLNHYTVAVIYRNYIYRNLVVAVFGQIYKVHIVLNPSFFLWIHVL